MGSTNRDTFAGTMAVSQRNRFDLVKLEAYLRQHIDGFAGPLEVEQFKGGQSNPTFRLSAGGKRYVLRRKPPGKLLPSAHAVDREYRVMTALRDSDVPVPITRVCAPTTASSAPRSTSWIAWTGGSSGSLVADMNRSGRVAIFAEMNRVIAALHKVDYRRSASSIRQAGNYLARQIARWTKQYRASETEKTKRWIG